MRLAARFRLVAVRPDIIDPCWVDLIWRQRPAFACHTVLGIECAAHHNGAELPAGVRGVPSYRSRIIRFTLSTRAHGRIFDPVLS